MERQRKLAAEEADAMPDPSTLEQKAIADLLANHSLQEESIRPDGNCLYAAFASQLGRIKPQKVPEIVSQGLISMTIKR